MQFKSLTLAAIGFTAGAYAAVSADQMVANIDTITDLSSQNNDIAQSLSITNAFSMAPQVINNFYEIIQTASNDVTAMNSHKRSVSTDKLQQKRQECLNVTDVQKCLDDLMEIIEDPNEILGDKKRSVVGGGSAIGARQADAGYTTSQQEAVCAAFRGFVTVHQQLLATVIGKHGLLSLTPFTQPMAQVLRVLEGGVDRLAFGIIDAVPTCAQSATDNKNALDGTLEDAVDQYSS